jgi:hypothetical protein
VIFTSAGAVSRIERAALVAGLVLAAALSWNLHAAPTDATYTHLTYARHLASGQGLVFNIGERVYGCISPLWVTLVADAMALGADGFTAARVLGWLATLASVGFFFQLMRRTVRSTALRAAGTIVWASHAWLARWSQSGTETSLAVALTLAGFVAFVEGQAWGSRPRRTGALWALAALARPEAVLLLLLWGAFLLIDAESREGLRRMVAGALPPIVIYGTWLLFARIYFGTFWPQELSVPGFGAAAPPHWIVVAMDEAKQLAIADLVPVLLLGIALLAGGKRVWGQGGATQRFVPWAWVLALPVLYASRRMPVSTQHLLLVAPILSWLSWRALDHAWPSDAQGRRRGLAWTSALAVLFGVAFNLSLYQRRIVPEATETRRALNAGPVAWGQWFGRHTEPGATIATPEIGAIGYFSGRRVIDLSGVISPAMVRSLQDESVGDASSAFRFAAFARPDFIVERSPRPYDMVERSRYAGALVPLGHTPAADTSVYSFYRIDWAAFDSLRARH